MNNVTLHSAVQDQEGFAGSLGAVSNDKILLVGGSNFPDGQRPWNGGTKVWYKHILMFDSQENLWKKIGEVAEPIGYAAHGNWNQALVYAGGSNAHGHTNKAFVLRLVDATVQIDTLPSLPHTLANSSGAVIDDTFYVVGGLIAPDSAATLSTLYALDLKRQEEGWKRLADVPFSSMLNNVACIDQTLYVFSGTDLFRDKEGKIQRTYLKSAAAYTVSTGAWEMIPSLPSAAVAGVATVNDGVIRVIGGDSGALAAAAPMKEAHPGFNTFRQEYDPAAGTWDNLPLLLEKGILGLPVTTTVVRWKGRDLLLGGEIKPGIRTPQILDVTQ